MPTNTSITIIDTYAPTVDKQRVLIQCIDACKKLNTDILLVSHCTLPEHIISMVDYYIFDRDNRFNNTNAFAWKCVGNLTVNLNIRYSHEFPIIKSMRNAFSLAHGLGYEFFYFTEFDHIFSESDIERIKKLREDAYETDKDFIFFGPSDAVWIINGIEKYGIYYETSFFAGKVTPFITKFNRYFPGTLEEYNSSLALMVDETPGCLEHLFYDAFHTELDKSIVIQNYVKEYFHDSRTNVSSYKSTTCKVLPANDGKHYLYVSNDNTNQLLFKVYFNDIEVNRFPLINNSPAESFTLLELLYDTEIRVDVYENDTLIHTHTEDYNMNNFDRFVTNGSVHIA